jgi:2-keto-4-pentenoate hydratase/2-oxohepta-3-ene-1,7-dioic acid hydratase in catechol pathway
MRFVRFYARADANPWPRLGVLLGQSGAAESAVADLTSVAPAVGDDLTKLIERWDELGGAPGLDRLGRAAPRLAPSEVRILAPIVPRRNIIAVGRNYRDHAAEFSSSGFDASERQVIPDHPVVFTKWTSSVVGPDDAIVLANDPSGTTDYEGELGVVIGRRGRNIRRADALEHVFGWTLVNDVTARELQKRHVQWFIGKSPDTFCPIGPCVTSRDELADIGDLRLRTRVNGELRQDMATTAMIFDVPGLIETLSEVMTLEPGDVIATGTGLGVGIGFDPPVYLRAGDVVEVEAEGIGTLRNPVV